MVRLHSRVTGMPELSAGRMVGPVALIFGSVKQRQSILITKLGQCCFIAFFHAVVTLRLLAVFIPSV